VHNAKHKWFLPIGSPLPRGLTFIPDLTLVNHWLICPFTCIEPELKGKVGTLEEGTWEKYEGTTPPADESDVDLNIDNLRGTPQLAASLVKAELLRLHEMIQNEPDDDEAAELSLQYARLYGYFRQLVDTSQARSQLKNLTRYANGWPSWHQELYLSPSNGITARPYSTVAALARPITPLPVPSFVRGIFEKEISKLIVQKDAAWEQGNEDEAIAIEEVIGKLNCLLLH